MRQYELAIRIAQVHHLVDERKYKKALAVIETLDMRQVRSLGDLKVFAEVYIKTEQYEAAKATYLRIYRRSHTKRILYRLIYLSIRTNALEDAENYYQEFIGMNPNARDVLILRYRIDKASGAPIGRLIEILQDLKQEEYIEEWAYELAKLYHRAGRKEECMEECEDILLWFGTGEIVERAKILMDHMQDEDSLLYYDDKDFTVPKKEEPNPEDTGSLPDLNEYLHEEKEKQKSDRVEEKESDSEESQEEEAFLDDYDDGEFEEESIDISQKAMDGIQKISGLFGHVKKASEKKPEKTEKAEKSEKAEKNEPQIKQTKEQKEPVYVPHSQSGTGITQDLAKEISAIYEMEHKEQLKEKAVTILEEAPNAVENVVERMTEAIRKTTEKTYIPLDIEEITQENNTEKESDISEGSKKTLDEILEEEIAAIEKQKEEETDGPEEAIEDTLDMSERVGYINEFDSYPETEKSVVEEDTLDLSGETLLAEEVVAMTEAEGEQEEAVLEEMENISKQEETEVIKSLLEEEIEDPETPQFLNTPEEENTSEMTATEEKEENAETDDSMADAPDDTMEEDGVSDTEDTKDLSQEIRHTSVLEGYVAPDIPVVETEYMEIPEIQYDELPTTRALQQSFGDVLRLIGGELDPSHFVLMGDGEDRILGVSKQIVRVMKESGYLSIGRIAKTKAEALNQMDFISFRNQLRGNCLLVENAADLLFPTITKIFSIMDEYHGDFVVILADEGTTLDQLFRFVPALARRFKYVIDISKYTEKDYNI